MGARITDIIKALHFNELFRNTLTLLTGTGLGQIIPLVASPLLTRLYNPSQFGVYTIFYSIASTLALVATWRYEMAIVLPEEKEHADSLVVLSFIATLLTTIAAGIVCFLLYVFSHQALTTIQPWINFLPWIPVTILSLGFFQACYYYSIRHNRYKKIAVARILQSSLWVIISILLSWFKIGSIGLVIAFALAQFVSAIYLLVVSKISTIAINKKNIKQVSVTYKNFPLFNTFHVISDAVQLYGTTFLIGYFFGYTVVGNYGLSFRVLRSPLSVIGSAIGQAIYPQLSNNYNKGYTLYKPVKQTMLILALLAIVPFIALILFAPPMFSFFFGNQWYEAGIYTQILAPWLILNFIISPVSQIPYIYQEQKKYLLFTAINALTGALLLSGMAFYTHRDTYSFLILMAVNVIYNIRLLFWFIGLSKKKKSIGGA